MGDIIARGLAKKNSDQIVVLNDIASKSKIINNEISNGKNLFNKANVTAGYDLNNSGVATTSANYSVTDFIPVLASTSYVGGAGSNYNICFYDTNKIFISKLGGTPNTPITSPSNASFARISLLTTNINIFQIEAGTVATAYEPYQFLFDRMYIKNRNQINGNLMYADDNNWNNFLKNGDLSQSGTPANFWSFIGNATLTLKNGSTPAAFNINSATTWSAMNTSYIYSLASKRIAVAYNFTISGANFNSCNFKVWFKGSGGQTYSQQTMSVGNGTYKGVFILDIQSDAVISAFQFQFSEFSGTTAGQNSQAAVSINYFMCFDISGSSHAYNFTKEQIQKSIDFRGGYYEGLLLNFLNTRHADEAVIANYAKYVDSTWKGKKFVSFGDSLTAMGLWQPHVISKLGFLNHVNCGVGGTAVSVRDNAGVSHNADSFFQDTRINAIPNDADLITVMGGFNDFNQFTQIGGSLPSLDSTTFKGALSLTIEKILKKPGMNPNVRIILMTQPYGFTDPAPTRANVSLKQIVDAIKEVGQFYGLPVIDLYGNSGWNYVNRNTFLSDSVHPNEAGGKRMAEVITGTLKSIEPTV